LVTNMDMWKIMTLIISKIHQDKNSIKHTDSRHKTPDVFNKIIQGLILT
jgi:hypothetical protein